MASHALSGVLRYLQRSAILHKENTLTDSQLLERYIHGHDEAAFEAIMYRHGPMVLGVCRRILRNEADAEDAFQATFLVLVRKAASIQPRSMVSNWLYGVAHNTALKAKSMRFKRSLKERSSVSRAAAVNAEGFCQKLEAILDEELSRLSQKYRSVIVLCELEGKTIKEAARLLGCPQGTAATRLSRGRRWLAKRLSLRGITVPGGSLAIACTAESASTTLPLPLCYATIEATRQSSTKLVAGGTTSAKVVALAKGVLTTMFLKQLRMSIGLAATIALILMAVHLSGTPAHPQMVQQQEKQAEKQPDPLAFGEQLAKQGKFVVVGTVLEADGTTPIEGVVVRASAGMGTLLPTGETKTGRDGKFRLIFSAGGAVGGSGPGGVAVVHVFKPGWYGWHYGWPPQYILTSKPLSVAEKKAYLGYTNLTPGKPSQLMFRMQPAASFTVKVVDKDGKPIPNMPIALTGKSLPPGSSVIASGQTNAAGEFSAKDVPRRTYSLIIEDRVGKRGELELGSINFRDAVEYSVIATIYEWTRESMHTSLKATRGKDD